MNNVSDSINQFELIARLLLINYAQITHKVYRLIWLYQILYQEVSDLWPMLRIINFDIIQLNFNTRRNLVIKPLPRK